MTARRAVAGRGHDRGLGAVRVSSLGGVGESAFGESGRILAGADGASATAPRPTGVGAPLARYPPGGAT